MYKHDMARITGPLIKTLRKQRNMTQNELAYIMDIDRTTVANWERTQRAPTAQQYCELAAIFDVSIEYLIGKEKKKEHRYNSCNEVQFERLNELGKKVLTDMYNVLIKNDLFTHSLTITKHQPITITNEDDFVGSFVTITDATNKPAPVHKNLQDSILQEALKFSQET